MCRIYACNLYLIRSKTLQRQTETREKKSLEKEVLMREWKEKSHKSCWIMHPSRKFVHLTNKLKLFIILLFFTTVHLQTHCYNPVVPAYLVWAYYVHGRQHRCQEDPVSLPSGRLEKTTRSSPHHVAQHRPTGSETTPSCTPGSSRFGLEPLSVEDDVDVWR